VIYHHAAAAATKSQGSIRTPKFIASHFLILSPRRKKRPGESRVHFCTGNSLAASGRAEVSRTSRS